MHLITKNSRKFIPLMSKIDLLSHFYFLSKYIFPPFRCVKAICAQITSICTTN